MSENGEVNFDFIFQKKILGIYIRDEQFLFDYGSIIKQEFFSDPYLKQICGFVNDYFEKYDKQPTPEVLIEEINNSARKEERQLLLSSIEELLELNLEDSVYYKDKVLEFCKRQALVNALKRGADHLRAGNIETILPEIENAFQVGENASLQKGGVDYWNCFSEEEAHNPQEKIATLLGEPGSGGLDDVLDGGLERSSVGMMMMPTGRGKSVFLVNVAGGAIFQGKNVLFVSFELEEKKLIQRFNMFFSGKTTKELREIGSVAVGEEIKKKYTGLPMGNLVIKTFPMKSLTIRQLNRYITEVEKQFGWKVDMLALDYLDVVKPPFPSKEGHECLSDLSVQLKGLAQEREIPIWTACQVNKVGSEKQIIQNTHASGSYQKIFALDVVLTSSPKVDPETGERTAVVFCSKNRQALDQGSVDFLLDLERMRFVHKKRSDRNHNADVAYKRYIKDLRK